MPGPRLGHTPSEWQYPTNVGDGDGAVWSWEVHLGDSELPVVYGPLNLLVHRKDSCAREDAAVGRVAPERQRQSRAVLQERQAPGPGQRQRLPRARERQQARRGQGPPRALDRGHRRPHCLRGERGRPCRACSGPWSRGHRDADTSLWCVPTPGEAPSPPFSIPAARRLRRETFVRRQHLSGDAFDEARARSVVLGSSAGPVRVPLMSVGTMPTSVDGVARISAGVQWWVIHHTAVPVPVTGPALRSWSRHVWRGPIVPAR